MKTLRRGDAQQLIVPRLGWIPCACTEAIMIPVYIGVINSVYISYSGVHRRASVYFGVWCKTYIDVRRLSGLDVVHYIRWCIAEV